jgi:hypothetical protein
MHIWTLLVILITAYPACATDELSRPKSPATNFSIETQIRDGITITRELAPLEIREDYEDAGPIAKILDSTERVNNEDYVSDQKKRDITYRPLQKMTTQDSTLVYVGKTVGRGVLHFLVNTTRFSLGCVAVQYWGVAACEVVGNTAYAVTLHYTANPWIARAAYHLGRDTLAPLTGAVLFYVAAHTPDLLYFTIKGTIYSLKLTYEGGRWILRTGGQVYMTFKDLFNNEKQRNGMIEMMVTGTLSPLLEQKG